MDDVFFQETSIALKSLRLVISTNNHAFRKFDTTLGCKNIWVTGASITVCL